MEFAKELEEYSHIYIHVSFLAIFFFSVIYLSTCFLFVNSNKKKQLAVEFAKELVEYGHI